MLHSGCFLSKTTKSKGDPRYCQRTARSICWRNTCRERLLINIIRFRAGRSRVDTIKEVVNLMKVHSRHCRLVVLVVTLDVKKLLILCSDATCLRCCKIGPVYTFSRVLGDYLKCRVLLYYTREGHRKMKVSSGVAPDSIVALNFWSVLNDSPLRLEMPNEFFCWMWNRYCFTFQSKSVKCLRTL